MKIKIFFISLFLLTGTSSFSQSKIVRNHAVKNIDSLKWEKENINWETRLFNFPELVNKLKVSKKDGAMDLYQSMNQECRIFGYSKPNENSKKLLLLSIWTFDVQGNPSNATFGSYYDTSSMEDLTLKFINKSSDFVKAAILKDNVKVSTVYFKSKWVEFEIE